MNKSSYLKFVSSATAVLFLISDLALAAPMSLGMPSVEIQPKPIGIESASSANIIPKDYGRVEDIHLGLEKMIFHIQTAHGHYEAQKNIQNILSHLDSEFGVNTILMEGSFGQLDPERTNWFPNDPEKTKEINEILLKHAFLKGSEMYLMNAENAIGLGIEDRETYDQNAEAFVQVLRQKEKSEKFLKLMDEVMNRISSHHLNSRLKSFLKQVEAYENEVISFETWIDVLKKQSQEVYGWDLTDTAYQLDIPMLVRLFKIQTIQENFDRLVFEQEREAFLKLGYFSSEIQAFIREVMSKPIGDMSHDLHTIEQAVTIMMDSLPEDFNYRGFENIVYYWGMLVMHLEIDAMLLMEETEMIEEKLYDRLAKTSEEMAVIQILKQYRMLKKLFDLKLTPSDYEKIQGGTYDGVRPSVIVGQMNQLKALQRTTKKLKVQNVQELDQLFDRAFDFYKYAKERDQIMIERVEERLEEQNVDRVAIITGGFHSEPFKDHFTNRDYTYALLTPQITSQDEKGYQEYIDAIFRQVPAEVGAATLEAVATLFLDQGITEAQYSETIANAARVLMSNGLSEADAKSFMQAAKNVWENRAEKRKLTGLSLAAAAVVAVVLSVLPAAAEDEVTEVKLSSILDRKGAPYFDGPAFVVSDNIGKASFGIYAKDDMVILTGEGLDGDGLILLGRSDVSAIEFATNLAEAIGQAEVTNIEKIGDKIYITLSDGRELTVIQDPRGYLEDREGELSPDEYAAEYEKAATDVSDSADTQPNVTVVQASSILDPEMVPNFDGDAFVVTDNIGKASFEIRYRDGMMILFGEGLEGDGLILLGRTDVDAIEFAVNFVKAVGRANVENIVKRGNAIDVTLSNDKKISVFSDPRLVADNMEGELSGAEYDKAYSEAATVVIDASGGDTQLSSREEKREAGDVGIDLNEQGVTQGVQLKADKEGNPVFEVVFPNSARVEFLKGADTTVKNIWFPTKVLEAYNRVQIQVSPRIADQGVTHFKVFGFFGNEYFEERYSFTDQQLEAAKTESGVHESQRVDLNRVEFGEIVSLGDRGVAVSVTLNDTDGILMGTTSFVKATGETGWKPGISVIRSGQELPALSISEGDLEPSGTVTLTFTLENADGESRSFNIPYESDEILYGSEHKREEKRRALAFLAALVLSASEGLAEEREEKPAIRDEAESVEEKLSAAQVDEAARYALEDSGWTDWNNEKLEALVKAASSHFSEVHKDYSAQETVYLSMAIEALKTRFKNFEGDRKLSEEQLAQFEEDAEFILTLSPDYTGLLRSEGEAGVRQNLRARIAGFRDTLAFDRDAVIRSESLPDALNAAILEEGKTLAPSARSSERLDPKSREEKRITENPSVPGESPFTMDMVEEDSDAPAGEVSLVENVLERLNVQELVNQVAVGAQARQSGNVRITDEKAQLVQLQSDGSVGSVFRPQNLTEEYLVGVTSLNAEVSEWIWGPGRTPQNFDEIIFKLRVHQAGSPNAVRIIESVTVKRNLNEYELDFPLRPLAVVWSEVPSNDKERTFSVSGSKQVALSITDLSAGVLSEREGYSKAIENEDFDRAVAIQREAQETLELMEAQMRVALETQPAEPRAIEPQVQTPEKVSKESERPVYPKDRVFISLRTGEPVSSSRSEYRSEDTLETRDWVDILVSVSNVLSEKGQFVMFGASDYAKNAFVLDSEELAAEIDQALESTWSVAQRQDEISQAVKNEAKKLYFELLYYAAWSDAPEKNSESILNNIQENAGTILGNAATHAVGISFDVNLGNWKQGTLRDYIRTKLEGYEGYERVAEPMLESLRSEKRSYENDPSANWYFRNFTLSATQDMPKSLTEASGLYIPFTTFFEHKQTKKVHLLARTYSVTEGGALKYYSVLQPLEVRKGKLLEPVTVSSVKPNFTAMTTQRKKMSPADVTHFGFKAKKIDDALKKSFRSRGLDYETVLNDWNKLKQKAVRLVQNDFHLPHNSRISKEEYAALRAVLTAERPPVSDEDRNQIYSAINELEGRASEKLSGNYSYDNRSSVTANTLRELIPGNFMPVNTYHNLKKEELNITDGFVSRVLDLLDENGQLSEENIFSAADRYLYHEELERWQDVYAEDIGKNYLDIKGLIVLSVSEVEHVLKDLLSSTPHSSVVRPRTKEETLELFERYIQQQEEGRRRTLTSRARVKRAEQRILSFEYEIPAGGSNTTLRTILANKQLKWEDITDVRVERSTPSSDGYFPVESVSPSMMFNQADKVRVTYRRSENRISADPIFKKPISLEDPIYGDPADSDFNRIVLHENKRQAYPLIGEGELVSSENGAVRIDFSHSRATEKSQFVFKVVGDKVELTVTQPGERLFQQYIANGTVPFVPQSKFTTSESKVVAEVYFWVISQVRSNPEIVEALKEVDAIARSETRSASPADLKAMLERMPLSSLEEVRGEVEGLKKTARYGGVEYVVTVLEDGSWEIEEINASRSSKLGWDQTRGLTWKDQSLGFEDQSPLVSFKIESGNLYVELIPAAYSLVVDQDAQLQLKQSGLIIVNRQEIRRLNFIETLNSLPRVQTYLTRFMEGFNEGSGLYHRKAKLAVWSINEAVDYQVGDVLVPTSYGNSSVQEFYVVLDVEGNNVQYVRLQGSWKPDENYGFGGVLAEKGVFEIDTATSEGTSTKLAFETESNIAELDAIRTREASPFRVWRLYPANLDEVLLSVAGTEEKPVEEVEGPSLTVVTANRLEAVVRRTMTDEGTLAGLEPNDSYAPVGKLIFAALELQREGLWPESIVLNRIPGDEAYRHVIRITRQAEEGEDPPVFDIDMNPETRDPRAVYTDIGNALRFLLSSAASEQGFAISERMHWATILGFPAYPQMNDPGDYFKENSKGLTQLTLPDGSAWLLTSEEVENLKRTLHLDPNSEAPALRGSSTQFKERLVDIRAENRMSRIGNLGLSLLTMVLFAMPESAEARNAKEAEAMIRAYLNRNGYALNESGSKAVDNRNWLNGIVVHWLGDHRLPEHLKDEYAFKGKLDDLVDAGRLVRKQSTSKKKEQTPRVSPPKKLTVSQIVAFNKRYERLWNTSFRDLSNLIQFMAASSGHLAARDRGTAEGIARYYAHPNVIPNRSGNEGVNNKRPIDDLLDELKISKTGLAEALGRTARPAGEVKTKDSSLRDQHIDLSKWSYKQLENRYEILSAIPSNWKQMSDAEKSDYSQKQYWKRVQFLYSLGKSFGIPIENGFPEGVANYPFKQPFSRIVITIKAKKSPTFPKKPSVFDRFKRNELRGQDQRQEKRESAAPAVLTPDILNTPDALIYSRANASETALRNYLLDVLVLSPLADRTSISSLLVYDEVRSEAPEGAVLAGENDIRQADIPLKSVLNESGNLYSLLQSELPELLTDNENAEFFNAFYSQSIWRIAFHLRSIALAESPKLELLQMVYFLSQSFYQNMNIENMTPDMKAGLQTLLLLVQGSFPDAELKGLDQADITYFSILNILAALLSGSSDELRSLAAETYEREFKVEVGERERRSEVRDAGFGWLKTGLLLSLMLAGYDSLGQEQIPGDLSSDSLSKAVLGNNPAQKVLRGGTEADYNEIKRSIVALKGDQEITSVKTDEQKNQAVLILSDGSTLTTMLDLSQAYNLPTKRNVVKRPSKKSFDQEKRLPEGTFQSEKDLADYLWSHDEYDDAMLLHLKKREGEKKAWVERFASVVFKKGLTLKALEAELLISKSVREILNAENPFDAKFAKTWNDAIEASYQFSETGLDSGFNQVELSQLYALLAYRDLSEVVVVPEMLKTLGKIKVFKKIFRNILADAFEDVLSAKGYRIKRWWWSGTAPMLDDKHPWIKGLMDVYRRSGASQPYMLAELTDEELKFGEDYGDTVRLQTNPVPSEPGKWAFIIDEKEDSYALWTRNSTAEDDSAADVIEHRDYNVLEDLQMQLTDLAAEHKGILRHSFTESGHTVLKFADGHSAFVFYEEGASPEIIRYFPQIIVLKNEKARIQLEAVLASIKNVSEEVFEGTFYDEKKKLLKINFSGTVVNVHDGNKIETEDRKEKRADDFELREFRSFIHDGKSHVYVVSEEGESNVFVFNNGVWESTNLDASEIGGAAEIIQKSVDSETGDTTIFIDAGGDVGNIVFKLSQDGRTLTESGEASTQAVIQVSEPRPLLERLAIPGLVITLGVGALFTVGPLSTFGWLGALAAIPALLFSYNLLVYGKVMRKVLGGILAAAFLAFIPFMTFIQNSVVMIDIEQFAPYIRTQGELNELRRHIGEGRIISPRLSGGNAAENYAGIHVYSAGTGKSNLWIFLSRGNWEAAYHDLGWRFESGLKRVGAERISKIINKLEEERGRPFESAQELLDALNNHFGRRESYIIRNALLLSLAGILCVSCATTSREPVSPFAGIVDPATTEERIEAITPTNGSRQEIERPSWFVEPLDRERTPTLVSEDGPAKESERNEKRQKIAWSGMLTLGVIGLSVFLLSVGLSERDENSASGIQREMVVAFGRSVDLKGVGLDMAYQDYLSQAESLKGYYGEEVYDAIREVSDPLWRGENLAGDMSLMDYLREIAGYESDEHIALGASRILEILSYMGYTSDAGLNKGESVRAVMDLLRVFALRTPNYNEDGSPVDKSPTIFYTGVSWVGTNPNTSERNEKRQKIAWSGMLTLGVVGLSVLLLSVGLSERDENSARGTQEEMVVAFGRSVDFRSVGLDMAYQDYLSQAESLKGYYGEEVYDAIREVSDPLWRGENLAGDMSLMDYLREIAGYESDEHIALGASRILEILSYMGYTSDAGLNKGESVRAVMDLLRVFALRTPNYNEDGTLVDESPTIFYTGVSWVGTNPNTSERNEKRKVTKVLLPVMLAAAICGVGCTSSLTINNQESSGLSERSGDERFDLYVDQLTDKAIRMGIFKSLPHGEFGATAPRGSVRYLFGDVNGGFGAGLHEQAKLLTLQQLTFMSAIQGYLISQGTQPTWSDLVFVALEMNGARSRKELVVFKDGQFYLSEKGKSEADRLYAAADTSREEKRKTGEAELKNLPWLSEDISDEMQKGQEFVFQFRLPSFDNPFYAIKENGKIDAYIRSSVTQRLERYEGVKAIDALDPEFGPLLEVGVTYLSQQDESEREMVFYQVGERTWVNDLGFRRYFKDGSLYVSAMQSALKNNRALAEAVVKVDETREPIDLARLVQVIDQLDERYQEIQRRTPDYSAASVRNYSILSGVGLVAGLVFTLALPQFIVAALGYGMFVGFVVQMFRLRARNQAESQKAHAFGGFMDFASNSAEIAADVLTEMYVADARLSLGLPPVKTERPDERQEKRLGSNGALIGMLEAFPNYWIESSRDRTATKTLSLGEDSYGQIEVNRNSGWSILIRNNNSAVGSLNLSWNERDGLILNNEKIPGFDRSPLMNFSYADATIPRIPRQGQGRGRMHQYLIVELTPEAYEAIGERLPEDQAHTRPIGQGPMGWQFIGRSEKRTNRVLTSLMVAAAVCGFSCTGSEAVKKRTPPPSPHAQDSTEYWKKMGLVGEDIEQKMEQTRLKENPYNLSSYDKKYIEFSKRYDQIWASKDLEAMIDLATEIAALMNHGNAKDRKVMAGQAGHYIPEANGGFMKGNQKRPFRIFAGEWFFSSADAERALNANRQEKRLDKLLKVFAAGVVLCGASCGVDNVRDELHRVAIGAPKESDAEKMRKNPPPSFDGMIMPDNSKFYAFQDRYDRAWASGDLEGMTTLIMDIGKYTGHAAGTNRGTAAGIAVHYIDVKHGGKQAYGKRGFLFNLAPELNLELKKASFKRERIDLGGLSSDRNEKRVRGVDRDLFRVMSQGTPRSVSESLPRSEQRIIGDIVAALVPALAPERGVLTGGVVRFDANLYAYLRENREMAKKFFSDFGIGLKELIATEYKTGLDAFWMDQDPISDKNDLVVVLPKENIELQEEMVKSIAKLIMSRPLTTITVVLPGASRKQTTAMSAAISREVTGQGGYLEKALAVISNPGKVLSHPDHVLGRAGVLDFTGQFEAERIENLKERGILVRANDFEATEDINAGHLFEASVDTLFYAKEQFGVKVWTEIMKLGEALRTAWRAEQRLQASA